VKLLVTGGAGLLGSEFVRAAHQRDGWDVEAPSRTEMDITDASACARVVAAASPDWVIHCAGFTKVDPAESEPDEVMRVNRDGSANVARAAVAAGAGIAHISTDYVFDGSKGQPYLPEDPVSPLGAYARSKVAAEESVLSAVRAGRTPSLIVRTGWLYGHGRRDFVDLVLDRTLAGDPLRIVDDQWGRPTWTRNVVRAVLDLIEAGARGVVNVSDGGTATWHTFATAIVEAAGLGQLPQAVSSRDYGAPADRPLYTVLDLAATEGELGREMMPWREALRVYLDERSSA
jgi:dTDP-4-dehydrorhamnose reductase